MIIRLFIVSIFMSEGVKCQLPFQFVNRNQAYDLPNLFQNQIIPPPKYDEGIFDNLVENPEQFYITEEERPLSMTEEAEKYWEDNKCIYPPQDFVEKYRDACGEVYNENNIYSGLCRTFYNASQGLCSLKNADDEEKETMLNLAELEREITDDDICDTLVGLKQAYPTLFPEPFGDNKWFSHTNNLLFRNDSCRNICSMPNLHPLCFGILLTYDFINDQRLAQELEKELEFVEDYEPEDDDENNLEIKTFDDIKFAMDGDAFLKGGALDMAKLNNDEDTDFFRDFFSPSENKLDKDINELEKKYYEYKAIYGNEDEIDKESPEMKEDLIASYDYFNFGDVNPKLLNPFKKDENLAIGDDEDWRDYDETKYEKAITYEDHSLMEAIFGFSCLLAVLMAAYIFKMRHRIFGRSSRTSRPNRWNYKKVDTNSGNY